MARLLLTGGSGFLGSQLMDAAKDRFETFATFFSHPFAGGLRLDVRDAEAVQAVFETVRPDVVVHTAYDKSRDGWQRVISAGSANVAQAARQIGARLVHLSTDVVFSGERGWYREEDVPDPVTDYGKLKCEAERRVTTHAPNALLVRTSLIYGLDGTDSHSKFVVDGLRSGTPVRLFTDEYRCPIYVDDLMNALLELIVCDMRGPLHVAGPKRVSRYEFGVLLARFHGHDPAGLIATTPEAAGMVRPKDCSLNTDKARIILRTQLRGVSEVLFKKDEG